MLTQTANLTPADPGLVVLVTLLRFNGVGADPEQIRHRFGGSPVGIAEMLRLGKELGLKAARQRVRGRASPTLRCRR